MVKEKYDLVKVIESLPRRVKSLRDYADNILVCGDCLAKEVNIRMKNREEELEPFEGLDSEILKLVCGNKGLLILRGIGVGLGYLVGLGFGAAGFKPREILDR